MIRGMYSVDITIFLLKWGDEKVRCELDSPRLHDYTTKLASKYYSTHKLTSAAPDHRFTGPCRDSSTRILIYIANLPAIYFWKSLEIIDIDHKLVELRTRAIFLAFERSRSIELMRRLRPFLVRSYVWIQLPDLLSIIPSL